MPWYAVAPPAANLSRHLPRHTTELSTDLHSIPWNANPNPNPNLDVMDIGVPWGLPRHDVGLPWSDVAAAAGTTHGMPRYSPRRHGILCQAMGCRGVRWYAVSPCCNDGATVCRKSMLQRYVAKTQLTYPSKLPTPPIRPLFHRRSDGFCYTSGTTAATPRSDASCFTSGIRVDFYL